eukprot:1155962-Pelagomonas_calceolata.AAC.18
MKWLHSQIKLQSWQYVLGPQQYRSMCAGSYDTHTHTHHSHPPTSGSRGSHVVHAALSGGSTASDTNSKYGSCASAAPPAPSMLPNAPEAANKAVPPPAVCPEGSSRGRHRRKSATQRCGSAKGDHPYDAQPECAGGGTHGLEGERSVESRVMIKGGEMLLLWRNFGVRASCRAGVDAGPGAISPTTCAHALEQGSTLVQNNNGGMVPCSTDAVYGLIEGCVVQHCFTVGFRKQMAIQCTAPNPYL